MLPSESDATIAEPSARVAAARAPISRAARALARSRGGRSGDARVERVALKLGDTWRELLGRALAALRVEALGAVGLGVGERVPRGRQLDAVDKALGLGLADSIDRSIDRRGGDVAPFDGPDSIDRSIARLIDPSIDRRGGRTWHTVFDSQWVVRDARHPHPQTPATLARSHGILGRDPRRECVCVCACDCDCDSRCSRRRSGGAADGSVVARAPASARAGPRPPHTRRARYARIDRSNAYARIDRSIDRSERLRSDRSLGSIDPSAYARIDRSDRSIEPSDEPTDLGRDRDRGADVEHGVAPQLGHDEHVARLLRALERAEAAPREAGQLVLDPLEHLRRNE